MPEKEQEDHGESRRQLWTAVITAGATIVVAIIGLFGTLYATGRSITSDAAPTTVATATVTATVTEHATAIPSAGQSTANSSPNSSAVDSTAENVNWNSTADDYLDQEPGFLVAYDCPSNGIAQTVDGTDLYYYSSSVCTAAVHAGLISLKKGGQVIIRMREPPGKFRGTKRNGITSESFEDDNAPSFEFLK